MPKRKYGLFINKCFSAQWGGGITYHLALVAAFEKIGVSAIVRFPRSMNFEELRTKIPQEFTKGFWQHDREMDRIPVISEIRNALKDRRYPVLVRHSNEIPPFTFNRNAYVQVDFPNEGKLRWIDRLRLKSYKGILTNSDFSATWVQKYWNRKAEVFFPPVEQIHEKPKKNIILSTGRFVEPHQGRSKRQDMLIEQFKKISSEISGWELHLAGYIQDVSYKKDLEEMVKGFPIYLHFNLLRKELETLFSKSAIYWHAVGFDCDEETEPIAMEHYGISTVEAMSTGCIPVVVNKGGQREIVSHESSGYLWDSPDEMNSYTMKLIADESLRKQLSENAKNEYKRFSFEQFCQQVEGFFKKK